ncbi:MAG TPA: GNAT family N-acetyltransferase [Candidatus Aminicenantes bacterium]|nr:GNAT family N-acetyltransferase [Candidatus Aminicenantes bacterium]
MSVRIRPFVPADYDRVMELWAEGGLPLKPRGRDSRKSVRRQIGLPNVLFLVAEEGKRGRVVGTVVATHDGRKGWVNRVAVEERLRRRGLGARLVRAAEAWLEAQGMDILACLVEAGNAVSMAVFGKLGYTKHPEIVYFAKRRFPGA